MKNIIIVTGGAGFVGANLIEVLLKKTKKRIISIDNYSTGDKKNHMQNKRIKYYKLDTSQINKKFFKIKKKYIQYFILVNLQESIKVLKILINVMIQTRLERKQYLNFVWRIK